MVQPSFVRRWLKEFLRRNVAGNHQAHPPRAAAAPGLSEEQRRRLNTERLLTLAGLPQDHPVWQVVLSYADEHARNELAIALSPGLADPERQYNAGRAASADDFAQALRDLRIKAEQEAHRIKNR